MPKDPVATSTCALKPTSTRAADCTMRTAPPPSPTHTHTHCGCILIICKQSCTLDTARLIYDTLVPVAAAANLANLAARIATGTWSGASALPAPYLGTYCICFVFMRIKTQSHYVMLGIRPPSISGVKRDAARKFMIRVFQGSNILRMVRIRPAPHCLQKPFSFKH